MGRNIFRRFLRIVRSQLGWLVSFNVSFSFLLLFSAIVLFPLNKAYQSYKPLNVLKIDRSKPFDPRNFIGGGWRIEEEDERSIALDQVDLTKIHLESVLTDSEDSINGEERLRRLRGKRIIRLDAKILETLLQNLELVPESWKSERDPSIPLLIMFDGTILRSPFGDRSAIGLYWSKNRWRLYILILNTNDWNTNTPSAVLVS